MEDKNLNKKIEENLQENAEKEEKLTEFSA